MVKAKFDKKNCVITIKGHSGYAEKGKDIVCAGISALVIAMETFYDKVAFAERNLPKKEQTVTTLVESGNAEFTYSNKNFTCVLFAEYFTEVFLKFAESYPEYLEVTEIKSNKKNYRFEK